MMTKGLKFGGQCSHLLFDHFDKIRENGVAFQFNRELKKGDRFVWEDVEYLVEEVDKNIFSGVTGGVVRMVRYKIGNTNTQFVHKCPARKSAFDRLSEEDIVKLSEKMGGKKVKSMKAGRVKMHSHNALEFQCPLCKTIFWKESTLLPDTVSVPKVMNKGKKKK